MRRVIAILLTLTIVFFVSGCAGISYYFQPNANPNVKWSTEDGVVWFVLDGKSDSAEIKGIKYYVRFNNANRMSFSDDDNWIRISFSCKFKKTRLLQLLAMTNMIFWV